MPTNVRSGITVVFSALFFNSAGATVAPSSATFTITYPAASNPLTTVSCAIDMTMVSSCTFTASWSSSVAALGLSSYSAAAPGQVTAAPGATGTLRVISP